MSTTGGYPPERLPTLTEVIDPAHTRPPPGDEDGSGEPVERRRAVMPIGAERRRVAIAPSAARPLPPQEVQLITRRVLEEVQRQIDLMLEYRLREAIGPALVRVADNLVRELRTELASTLRDLVARAVDEEIARHRGSSSER